MSPDTLEQIDGAALSAALQDIITKTEHSNIVLFLFCVFTIFAMFSSDAYLLGSQEGLFLFGRSVAVNAPLIGPVPLFVFLFLAPLVVIALKVYRYILTYYLDRVADECRARGIIDNPKPSFYNDPVLRYMHAGMFYVVPMCALLIIALKVAALPYVAGYFMSFLVVAVIIEMHTVRYLRGQKVNFRSGWMMTISAVGTVAIATLVLTAEHIRRPLILFREDLSNVWLAGLDLSGANLNYANMQGVDLSGARLVGAQLNFANLEGAVLTLANCQGAAFNQSNLSGADLSMADLSGAMINGASFRGARIHHTKMLGVVASGADFSQSDIIAARFDDADLTAAAFEEASLKGVLFLRARLWGANMRGADVDEVRVDGADARDVTGIAVLMGHGMCGSESTILSSGVGLKLCRVKPPPGEGVF